MGAMARQADPDSPDPTFDPDIAAWLAARATDPGALDASVEGLRASHRAVSALARAKLPGSDRAAREDDTVLVPEPAVKVRVFRPRDLGGPVPTVVYFHGGGWVAGDLDSHLAHCRQICRGLPAVVVAVGYRLAPENAFPAAFDDCLAATRAVIDRAAALGGDPSRVVVAGDSAGGQLAASVALAGEELPGPLAAQLLIVPVTDLEGGYLDPAVNSRYPSRAENRDGYGLTLDRMAAYARHYLHGDGGTRDWRASPLHASTLAEVAPAVVHTAGFDLLRDEGAAYADLLAAAGVGVTYRCWPTLNHTYSSLGGVSPAAGRAVETAIADLRELLGVI